MATCLHQIYDLAMVWPKHNDQETMQNIGRDSNDQYCLIKHLNSEHMYG